MRDYKQTVRELRDPHFVYHFSRDYLKNMMDDAADAIEELCELVDSNKTAVKHGRWIPVSERLPECNQEVLVTRHFLSDNQLKKNAITESFYVEVASWIGDEWTSYSDEYKIKRHLHKVIAWMPLPEPYKGEAETKDES